MTGHGGKRAGAGRPAGSKSKRTRELEERGRQAAAAIEAAIGAPFPGDALAFLQTIYRDPAQALDLRIDAAKAAVRYERPALASIEVQGEHHVRHVIQAEPQTPEERDREWLERHSGGLH